jgi:hypothetical protein
VKWSTQFPKRLPSDCSQGTRNSRAEKNFKVIVYIMFIEWANSLVLSYIVSEVLQKLENKATFSKLFQSCSELKFQITCLLCANAILSDQGVLILGDIALNTRQWILLAFRTATVPFHLVSSITGSSLLYASLITTVFKPLSDAPLAFLVLSL